MISCAGSDGARSRPAGGNNFFLYVRSSEVGAHANVHVEVEGVVTRHSPAEALAVPGILCRMPIG